MRIGGLWGWLEMTVGGGGSPVTRGKAATTQQMAAVVTVKWTVLNREVTDSTQSLMR